MTEWNSLYNRGSPWQVNIHFLWLVPFTYTCHRIPIRNKTNINLETGLNHSCFLLPVFFCFLKALHLKLFNVGKLVISNNILKQQLSFMLHKKLSFYWKNINLNTLWYLCWQCILDKSILLSFENPWHLYKMEDKK